MANQTTSVNIEGMLGAQGSFQTAVDEVNRTYTQMAGQIEALQSSWTGDASATFLSAMSTWLQDFGTVRQQLGLMLEKLQANTGTYGTTHQATTDVAAQLGRGMANPLPGF
ncbi:WXG100 family type VII secretion target [Streptomyces kaniharaensis]|uniref:ESAT-6-like protein n=1 Tax=Streptomyces kaniharaensis TaxID=212423 RepID=A0A6N7KXG0_9ACTN|nr:WXG100 family type VII secretion target [Streptomyces kaniharaensis]MQS16220.1 WXG100 family type VII secretion target [Streptomyces kaniharaensis]